MQQPRGGTVGFFRAISSLWLGAVLLVIILVGLACATLYESMHGTEQAMHAFYGSRWFHGLLGLFALSVLAAVVSRLPMTRAKIGFLVTHGSLLLIVGGALVTRLWGIDGRLALTEGESAEQLQLSGGERLTLTHRGSGASTSLDLDASVFGGLDIAEQPDGAALTLDGVNVRVVRYLPDSVAKMAVLDDAPTGRVAMEVSLSASGVDDPVWIFEGEPRPVGKTMISITNPPDKAELEKSLHPNIAASASSVGILKVRIADMEYELPVEACTSQAAALGETGYSVRVLDYFPHATVASGGGVINASPQPVNPAVRAEIVGPSGTQTKLAFARFPDFASSHGETGKDEVKLTFTASTASTVPSVPIEVFTTLGGEMGIRFATGIASSAHTVRIGEPVDTPWAGLKFAVLRKYDHARLRQELIAPAEIRQQRAPAVFLAVNSNGKSTDVWLQKNTPRSVTVEDAEYELAYADQTIALGFHVALNKFTVGYYPGGRRPRSFESQIAITDPATGHTLNRIISMNHPTAYGGYTFYQSSYELSGTRAMSVLSVDRDPGQLIVFAGYFTLMGGMCWVLLTKVRGRCRAASDPSLPDHARGNGSRQISLLDPTDRCVTRAGNGVPARYRQTGVVDARPLREQLSKPIALGSMMVALCVAAVPTNAKDVPASLDVTALRGLCVQHDGRYMPLDTLARDVVQSVTGKAYFQDHDPVVSLLAWTFEPEAWTKEPLIIVRNKELRREIGLSLDKSTFSYDELVGHQGLRALINGLVGIEPGRKMDPLETKVSGIHDKLTLLQTVFRGQVIRFIPDARDPLAAWKATDASVNTPFGAGWGALKAAFLADDAAAFARTSAHLVQVTAGLPAAFRPSPALLTTELRYNRLSPFSAAWRIMLIGTAVSAIAHFVRRRWFDVLAFVALIGGIGVLTYGLSLRWQIAGRIPASNMFESLLFLSWGVGAFAILSVPLFQQRLVPFTASAMSSLALVLADCLPVDQFIRPIAPVLLDTIWMSIHVPIIMVSYSVLTLAMLVAHIQLAVMAAAPKRTQLANTIDVLHYWYVHVGSILLTAGIITGSMWAASSWGRYWGWDPKEVWSLVALLGYLTILHIRIDHEHVPRWVYAVVGVLGALVLAVILPKLMPFSGGRLLGFVGTMVGMSVMVFARGQFATAAKSVICFWLIVMTYVGVNYVLGMGLHSYGFGTGAVARYMFMIGGLDLGFVVACALVYTLRHRPSFWPVALAPP